MVKRTRLALLAVPVTAFSLLASACGGSDSTATGTTKAGETATTKAGESATTKAPETATTAKAPAVTATLASSGATFPKAFYDQAISDFKKAQPGITQAYGGGGSGKGRQDFADQLVDWAGTDGLVKEEDKAKYKGGEFLYFPTVAAPITLSYNVAGVDKLQLTPELIAKIFQRQITKWNDPAIVAENAAAKLPDKAIVVGHRSDGSGTTENFTKFLVASAPSVWTLKSGSTVEWPADTQAGNGNAGVASIVKGTDGAIGYVDLSDAKATGLKFASVKNKAGKFVSPTLEGVTAALAGTKANPDLTYNPLWADGDAAYPISAPTWIIVYKNQTDKAKGTAIKVWLEYLLTEGQKSAPSIDYAALPADLQKAAKDQLAKLVIPA